MRQTTNELRNVAADDRTPASNVIRFADYAYLRKTRERSDQPATVIILPMIRYGALVAQG